ncbi:MULTISPECIES: c-type cytochrome [Niastella]|uniref:Cytochrome c n=1 Tax=Niastella soli TaxID=2821487 RepID=A0ABS3YX87_9BACT|nr:cytochrome c [Niastella soli]MBO9202030.1 cytochrome c [Niastella soli]
MKIALFVFWGIVVFIACNNPTTNNKSTLSTESAGENEEVTIVLEKVLDSPARNSIKVNVDYDQYFKSPKKYLGFSLRPLLDAAWKTAAFDTTHAMVLFECKDGYNPIMDLSKIYGPAQGYIVFKDLDQPDTKNWPDSLSQHFSPYYLVWDKVKKEDKSFFWPYGLTTIRLIPEKEKYRLIQPDSSDAAYPGYITFRDNCMKCHSINKIGGSFGPEFNLPKNITEYRDEKQLIAFAKAPASFRYNSRMPAMTSLSDKEFENIILYLKYMKEHKRDH